MNSLKKIPDGWAPQHLGNLVEIIGGGTPSKRNESFFTGNIPWITVRDLVSDEIFSSERSITKEAVKASATNLIPAKSLVIATRVGLGKVGKLKINAAINQDLKALIPKKDINADYLFYYLKSIADYIKANGFGATVKGVRLDFLESLAIPLPGIIEQKKIVQKLDQLFKKIDKSIDLVRESLFLVGTLKDSFLYGEFHVKTDSLKIVELNQLVKIIGGGTPSKKKAAYFLGDIPWVTVRDMKNDVILDTERKISEDAVKESATNIVKAGNVLLATRVGLGKVCKLGTDAAINQDIKALVPNKEINVDYLFLFLKSLSEYIKANGAGATVKGVNLKFIQSIKVPLPTLDEQERIVDRVERCLESLTMEASILSSQLHDLITLKSAILDYAFQGKLIVVPATKKSNQTQTFGLLQAVGAIIEGYSRTKYRFGEMVTAKYAFLLQHVFQVPLGIQFQNQSFGPYDKSIKKAVYAGIKQHYFVKDKHGALVLGDKASRILDSKYGLVTQVRAGMEQLTQHLKNATGHKVELLATVCKSIMDTGSTDFSVIKKHFEDWVTPEQAFATKADKFSDTEINNCIKFIMQQKWDKNLVA